MYSGIFKFLKIEKESFPVVFSSSMSACMIALEQYFKNMQMGACFFPLQHFVLDAEEISDRFSIGEIVNNPVDTNFYILGKQDHNQIRPPVGYPLHLLHALTSPVIFLADHSNLNQIEDVSDYLASMIELKKSKPISILFIVSLSEMRPLLDDYLKKIFLPSGDTNEKINTDQFRLTVFIRNIRTLLNENNARNIGREYLRTGVARVIYFFENQYFLMGHRHHD